MDGNYDIPGCTCMNCRLERLEKQVSEIRQGVDSMVSRAKTLA